MRFSIPAFLAACLVNILGIPVIFFFAFYGAMAAFGPNYKGDPRAASPLVELWLAGTRLTQFVLDHTVFDGPMPEPPSNGVTVGELAENPELAKVWNHFDAELKKRNLPYQLSYVASPLLFGLLWGFIYPNVFKKKA